MGSDLFRTMSPADRDFLECVYQALEDSRQRGEYPTFCSFWWSETLNGKPIRKFSTTGPIMVPPPTEPESADDQDDTAVMHAAEPDTDTPWRPYIEDVPDDAPAPPQDTTATDDVILTVLAGCTRPLKRASIASRGGSKNNSHFFTRLKRLCDEEPRRVMRCPGDTYWLTSRGKPPVT